MEGLHTERMKEQDDIYFRDAIAGSVSLLSAPVRLANVAVRAPNETRLWFSG
jgi:hypothetical protein